MYKEGIWYNGKSIIKGKYTYNWAADRFHIVLDKTDITGQKISTRCSGDQPEFNGYVLVEENGKINNDRTVCSRTKKLINKYKNKYK